MSSDKKNQVLDLLKIHFGYDFFRPGQERVIDNILAGKSTMVIMPTGGGKSLCYQLPALVLDGVTIVISPLIALMKDQVDGLNKIGIPATFVNSSISLAETSQRLQEIKNGFYKLLYIAPERFYNQEFIRSLADIKVGLFAIDEAHCISQWGHDFRPSYLKLKQAIDHVGNPPVMALTATATPEVREDIIKQLGIKNPELVITGFARPNLQFGVIQANEARKPQFVLDALSAAPNGAGIVYASTRARADELLSVLMENNIEAVGYHAGMETEDRKWVQENFMSGKAKVIVATNAFGLGIDKRDIRFVIHYDMPGTIEAYYQEAGRAGRDRKPSFCLLLYNGRDRRLQEFFIKGDNPPPEIILEIYEILTGYPFGNAQGRDSDMVLATYSKLKSMLSDDVPEMAVGTALKILEREGYIARSRERNGQAHLKIDKSPAVIFNALGKRAKNSREILEKIFGRFSEELKRGWSVNLEEAAGIIGIKKDGLARLIRKLADEGLAEYTPPFAGTEISILKRVPVSEVKINFAALKEKLRSAYQKLDRIEDYVYHFGCRQKYVLDYFGDYNSRACGKCDNCLTGGGYARKTERPERSPLYKKPVPHWMREGRGIYSRRKASEKIDNFTVEDDLAPKAKLPTKLTQLETFDLYNKGMNIEQIAAARGLKPSTIIEHICFLIEKKLPVDVNKFMDKAKQKKIIETAREVGFEKLALIKECLGDEINYNEIRLIVAKMKSHIAPFNKVG